MRKNLLLIVFFAFISVCTWAEYSPVILSLFDPIQFPNHDYDLHGLRLEIYGRCHDNIGLTLGLANVTDGKTYGVEYGGCHIFHDEVKGLVAGWVCICDADYYGLHASIFSMTKGTLHGLNIAGVSIDDDVNGLQLSAVGLAEEVKGVQIGAVNIAKCVKGVQIGAVNYTDDMCGIQIGVINILRQGVLPVFPIINMKF